MIKLKTLNIPFTDEEYKQLKKSKDHSKLSWHEFILTLVSKEDKQEFDRVE